MVTQGRVLTLVGQVHNQPTNLGSGIDSPPPNAQPFPSAPQIYICRTLLEAEYLYHPFIYIYCCWDHEFAQIGTLK